MNRQFDTIAAISTAPITAAIGIVRVSGKNAFPIVERIFDKPLNRIKSVLHGNILDGEQRIDDVLVTVFQAPNSYTGEDVVEISCHGSLYVLKTVMRLLIENGARQAKNGEFTKRAFINGKMDLSQAEAVIDLIESETSMEAKIAVNSLEGRLSEKINRIRQHLLDLCGQIMAFIDFPDDEIADVSTQTLSSFIRNSLNQIQELINTYSQGLLIKSGLKTVICGKPNVGKSCLMNRMSGYDRSIVTDVAGTTRDIITESVVFGGIKMSLTDTAGIRTAFDTVEKIGVERAVSSLLEADLILFVSDISRPLDDEDNAVICELEKTNAAKIAVLNKCDLGNETPVLTGFNQVVNISAKTGEGMDNLAKAVQQTFSALKKTDEAVNLRQYECLCRAEKALLHALDNICLTPDAVIVDVEDAVSALGEVIGKTISMEVVENIFSRFCVGK